MKRLTILAVVIAVVTALGLTLPVAVQGANPPGDKEDGAGNSNVAFLELYEKDASGNIVKNGARGTLKFNLAGPEFEFDFNGHKLNANGGYTLVRTYEPRCTHPQYCELIASGTANPGGNLHLAGSHDFHHDLTNASLRLVLTEDIAGISFTNWRPTEYLFEQTFINYDDIDTQLQESDSLSCGCQAPVPANFANVGLNIGEKAVDFTLSNVAGTESKLSQLLAEKPVVMFTGAFT